MLRFRRCPAARREEPGFARLVAKPQAKVGDGVDREFPVCLAPALAGEVYIPRLEHPNARYSKA
jgi:hypothetical protein